MASFLGIGLGGGARGLEAGLNLGLEQDKLKQQQAYQQGELGLRQQGLQLEQQLGEKRIGLEQQRVHLEQQRMMIGQANTQSAQILGLVNDAIVQAGMQMADGQNVDIAALVKSVQPMIDVATKLSESAGKASGIDGGGQVIKNQFGAMLANLRKPQIDQLQPPAPKGGYPGGGLTPGETVTGATVAPLDQPNMQTPIATSKQASFIERFTGQSQQPQQQAPQQYGHPVDRAALLNNMLMTIPRGTNPNLVAGLKMAAAHAANRFSIQKVTDPNTGMDQFIKVDKQTAEAFNPDNTPYVPRDQEINVPPGVSGDNYLKLLPPNTAAAVKAVGTYKVPMQEALGRMSAKGNQRQAFISHVTRAYPGDSTHPAYSQQNYDASLKAYEGFMSGKHGDSVRSYNVLVNHLGLLQKVTDAMGSGDAKLINHWKQAWQDQTGSSAPNDFRGVRDIVGKELVKAIQGGAGALGDREEITATLKGAAGPRILHSMINNYIELSHGQLLGLRKQYESTTYRDDFDRFLTDEAKALFEKAKSPDWTQFVR